MKTMFLIILKIIIALLAPLAVGLIFDRHKYRGKLLPEIKSFVVVMFQFDRSISDRVE